MKLKEFLLSNDLTEKEAQLSELVFKGLSNKTIANRFFIKEDTVGVLLQAIYKKLGVENRAQLISLCMSKNFIEDEEKYDQSN